MVKLKPCPFCGGEATVRIFKGRDGWRDRYAVICRYDEGGCGAESGLYHYMSEAIDAWNRRAEPEQKRGKWLWIDGVRCSNCNHKLQTTGLPSYCPNCGAKMEK